VSNTPISRANRLTYSPMSDRKPFSLILGNATRLLDDARLLVGHRRYASAFALALLGIEEIGKVLLKGWEAERALAKAKDGSRLIFRSKPLSLRC
jgi:hypothetical protein